MLTPANVELDALSILMYIKPGNNEDPSVRHHGYNEERVLGEDHVLAMESSVKFLLDAISSKYRRSKKVSPPVAFQKKEICNHTAMVVAANRKIFKEILGRVLNSA
jgi:hypothetical protein